MTITGDIFIVLMAWAVALTGYEFPEEMPMIIYADHSHFVEKLCDGVDTEKHRCVVRAYYNDDDPAKIYLNTKYWEINRPWTPHQTSVIVHEMVHYLQDLSGKYEGSTDWDEDKFCASRKERQIESYMAQDRYIFAVFGYRRLLPRYFHPCGH